LVAVHDCGRWTSDDGRAVPFVVMDLVEGHSLDMLLASGPLPWRRAVEICAQVASAVAALHECHLVHRDIKPGNVMLTDGRAKLVDFGISALIGDHSDLDHDDLLGTPAYVAPERLDRAPTAPAIDVYALGLMLYMMLSGRRPWTVDTPDQMLTAH